MATLTRLTIGLAAATLALCGAAGAPRAARQGKLGRSSAGQVRVSLRIPARVELRGLDDLAAAGGASAGCVFSTSGAYRVTASTHRGAAEVAWVDAAGRVRRLTPGRESDPLDASGASVTGCGDHPNAHLRVDGVPGAEGEVLTLMLSPE